MTNRTPRKFVTRIATAVAVTAAICMVVGYRLSATNSLPPDASQPNQYSFLTYSGEELWHVLPGR